MITFQDMDASLRFLAALGCGLIAGVFFAFSSFVMKALGKLPAESAIAAMQSINVYAVRSWFLAAFMGTALLCLCVLAFSLRHWNSPGASWAFAGALSYLLGTFLVTLVFNVPMNNALAALPPMALDRAEHWTGYLSRWTLWNHVRTVTALVALAFFILAKKAPPVL